LETRLNWLVFGAGAIGTYIGSSLMLHGQKVAFLEQPAACTQLRERGFKLNIRRQDYRILQPEVFPSLSDALAFSSYDVIIFALKSYDTQNALESIRPCAAGLPPVLCLQNGVENESILASVLGTDKVIAATITSSVGRRAAGDIVLERSRGVGVAAGHPLSSVIVAAFSDAELNVRLYPSAQSMKWSKMLTNLLANASSAILGMTPLEILSHPDLYHVEISQLREAIAVMRAQHIRPVNLPGTPVQIFAWLILHLSPTISQPLISRIAGSGRGQKMPSFYLDLHSGSGKSEVDYLNGAVARFGERLGISTPINHWLNQTLLSLTHGSLPLDKYTLHPDQFLKDVYSFTNKAL
jgi:2-dehydropantoate 2-reductase